MFKVGDKVVCVATEWWFDKKFMFFKYKKRNPFGPKKDIIYTVAGFYPENDYLMFTEFPRNSYEPACFRKVDFGHSTAERIEQEINQKQLQEI